jgi:hypothetical protein
MVMNRNGELVVDDEAAASVSATPSLRRAHLVKDGQKVTKRPRRVAEWDPFNCRS